MELIFIVLFCELQYNIEDERKMEEKWLWGRTDTLFKSSEYRNYLQFKK